MAATSGQRWPSFTREELENAPGYRLMAGGAQSRSACPIHGGDNPTAFVFNIATGWGQCHTRGCRGYLIDESKRRDWRDRSSARPKDGPPIPLAQPEPESDPDRIATLQRLWPRLVRAFPGSPAAAYLADRGIPSEVAQAARVGYDEDGELGYATSPTEMPPEQRKRSTRGRVVFPLANYNGQPINAAARRLSLPGNEPKEWRWVYLRGTLGYFNPAGLRLAKSEGRTVYLCEGAIDALALRAGGIATAVAIGGIGGVVKREHLRGLRRLVLCLDADKAGQSGAADIGRQARTLDCNVIHLTAAHLDGAKDVAEYWQARGTLPAILRELAAEEETALDADLVLEYAARYTADYIAERIADQWARWEDGERTPALRRTIADWQAFAAARARLDAERARERPDPDAGPDDGYLGEWPDLEP